MSDPKKRVRFEFDEASLKTLEQATEEGMIITDGGMAAYPDDVGISTLSPADRRRHHVAAQLESRDREIAQLLDETQALQQRVAELEGELREVRTKAFEEAMVACERVEAELEAHYKEFGYGASLGNVEAGGAISCQVAIEALQAEARKEANG